MFVKVLECVAKGDGFYLVGDGEPLWFLNKHKV